jgi:hypothetical protein
MGYDAGVPDDFWIIHQLDDFFSLSITRHNYTFSNLNESYLNRKLSILTD